MIKFNRGPFKPHHAMTFRVYSEHNGECKHVFYLRYKEVTWKNLLWNLFGDNDSEDQQLPTIRYYDDQNEVILQRTPIAIKQFARTALMKAYKGDCMNIIVPDYDKYSNLDNGSKMNEIKSLLRNSEINVDPNADSVRRKELQVTDITKIFASEIEASLKSSMQSKLNMYVHNNFENIMRIEKPLDREDLPQEEGKLHVRRLNNATMVDLLKEGTSLIVPTENNKFLLVNFVKDPFPVLNGMKLNWQRRDIHSYECDELKIPVTIGKELNYIFARDAEFVKNFDYHLSCAEQYAKQQSDYEKKKIKMKKTKENTLNLDKRFSKLTMTESAEPVASTSTTTVEASSSPVVKVEQPMQEDLTANPPKWFGEYLDKFKAQILEDVQKTVKSLITPSAAQNPEPSTSIDFSQINDNLRDDILDNDRLLKGYEMWLSGKHRGGVDGSGKKRPFALSSKREHGKMVEKMVEIGYGLYVISKAGFKVRMPRNASLTLRLILVKTSKCRSYKEEPELRVQYVSDGIECCIKSTGKSVDKLNSKDKQTCTYYDVRIKTKDKSGKFRLCFNVVHNGKIRGHSFKIDVRVRKVYTLSTAPDLIDLTSDEQSRCNVVFGQAAAQVLPSRPEEILTSGDLADEGIGGNQEDFYSPTSDSDDSDAEEPNFSDSKPDLPKDEGIDTCYHSTNFSEAGPLLEESANNSDSDTDSSISFLMDEEEARDELKEADDVINLPGIFFPNADPNEEVIPVRIRRKRSDLKRKTDKEDYSFISNSDSASQADRTFDSIAEPKHKPESAGKNAQDLFKYEILKLDAEQQSKPSYPRTVEEAEHAYYRSIYPNLQGLKEFVNPIADKKEENSPSHSKAEPSSSGVRFEPYPVNILPERVFETVSSVWKTVYNTKKSLSENENFPKQVQETVSSVFNSVSSEINNAATSAAAAAQVAAASAARAASAAAANAVPTSASNDTKVPTSNTAQATDSDFKTASGSSEASSAKSTSSTSKNKSNESDKKKNSAHLNTMYRNLSEEIREKLIILNDMGFVDDPYSVYLLEQFPNDLNKVIESLVNYSSV